MLKRKTRYMKSLIGKISIILIIIIIWNNNVNAQQSDPLLAITIKSSSAAEKNSINKLKDKQSMIGKMQTVISYNLSVVKDYEKKMNTYLSTVSSFVQNFVELKQILYTSKDIIKIMDKCKDAALNNPQGVIYSIIASHFQKLTVELGGLGSYIGTIVLSKEALLNDTERTLMIFTILDKLKTIRSKLFSLTFYIENYNLSDVAGYLFPSAYYININRKEIADKIIRGW